MGMENSVGTQTGNQEKRHWYSTGKENQKSDEQKNKIGNQEAREVRAALMQESIPIGRWNQKTVDRKSRRKNRHQKADRRQIEIRRKQGPRYRRKTRKKAGKKPGEQAAVHRSFSAQEKPGRRTAAYTKMTSHSSGTKLSSEKQRTVSAAVENQEATNDRI